MSAKYHEPPTFHVKHVDRDELAEARIELTERVERARYQSTQRIREFIDRLKAHRP